jgi:hypothetical protein
MTSVKILKTCFKIRLEVVSAMPMPIDLTKDKNTLMTDN